ncbi:hypothetical protein BDF20DRAFT_898794 [Mycotypha africana]|uniref:uncharacterized protein n=1 Tax=Mycotypha africana TaxID=64632 RepID=UPI0023001FBF|nr:uncharacterized protein BDF20DRAFT_898794 [Mycotypha africana]KAI8967710.1 hypothetical protein BDF20DRAFT_898794 [Mycotypha africana]
MSINRIILFCMTKCSDLVTMKTKKYNGSLRSFLCTLLIPFYFFSSAYWSLIHFLVLCAIIATLEDAEKYPIESTKAKVKALLSYKSKNSLPKSVRYHSASHQLLQGLMYRAIQHWCCISFKIAPIEVDVLRHNTPKSILYCVAAISMVTINHNNPNSAVVLDNDAEENSPKNFTSSKSKRQLSSKAMEDFKKDIAFYYYKQACSYLEEVIFSEDEDTNLSVVAIQCYFCLSYIASLLRLPHEQRTWHCLACETLKNKVNDVKMSPALLQCWYRWYYIDAWVSIALNQESLLPDKLPFPITRPSRLEEAEQPQQQSAQRGCAAGRCFDGSDGTPVVDSQNQRHQQRYEPTSQHFTTCITPRSNCYMSYDTLYEFVIMAQFMRRFNRATRTGKLPYLYERINSETEAWWRTVKQPNIHLANCYHSMRIVVIFSLLQYHQALCPVVHFDLLLDGLHVTLEILQGLQELKLMCCDQSTYHHMFYAIHQTLKMILLIIRQHREFAPLETFAKQQFEMNLCILEGTDAFRDDLYQMRSIASTIEADMLQFGLNDDVVLDSKRSVRVFRAVITAKSVKKAKKSHDNSSGDDRQH